MKNLLIATDFTNQSDIALKVGTQLASLTGLEPQFFHWDSISPRIKNMDMLPELSGLYVDSSDWGQEIPKHVEKDLKDQFSRTSLKAGEGKLQVLESTDFETVGNFLSDFDDAMVVVSNSDSDQLTKILFGSFVEKIVFQTNEDVFIAKKEITDGIKKVGVCFDPAQDQEDFLDKAISFAKKVKAEIDIIHVEAFDSREIYKNVFATETNIEKEKNDYMAYQRKLVTDKFQEYKQKIEAAGVKCDIELILTVDKAPAENLLNHLKNDPVDVIFVEPNPGFMDTFRFNSTSYDLIKHIPTNFVVVKGKA